MLQAPCFDCLSFNPLSLLQDCLAAPEVDIGRRQVVDAFVVSVMIVVADEPLDLGLEVLREEIILQQNTVLQGLVPALDLALGLRVIGCAANMIHSLVIKPFSQIT